MEDAQAVGFRSGTPGSTVLGGDQINLIKGEVENVAEAEELLQEAEERQGEVSGQVALPLERSIGTPERGSARSTASGDREHECGRETQPQGRRNIGLQERSLVRRGSLGQPPDSLESGFYQWPDDAAPGVDRVDKVDLIRGAGWNDNELVRDDSACPVPAF